jgi:hypothetical protein
VWTRPRQTALKGPALLDLYANALDQVMASRGVRSASLSYGPLFRANPEGKPIVATAGESHPQGP